MRTLLKAAFLPLFLIGLVNSSTASSPFLVERLAYTVDESLMAFSWSPVHDWEAENVSNITGHKAVGELTVWRTKNGPFDVQHISARDDAGNLLVFFWSPQHDWEVVNITEKTGVKVTGSATSWQTPNGQFIVEHLAATSTSGDLVDFYWSPQHDWQAVNVSQKTGIKVAGPATSWQTPNGPFNVEHLAAASASGDLVDFYWSPQHDWQAVNVSQKTGIKVAGPATSWQTPNGPFNVEHLAAASTLGDLVDFYWSPQHDWQAVNVSQKTAIKVAGPATSWQTPDGPFNVEHLAAASNLGDLVDFYWSPQHDWQAVNVSQITGVKVVGPPTSWQTPNAQYNVEHLAAITLSGDLSVFYWSPQHDWQAVNVTQTVLSNSDLTTKAVPALKVVAAPSSWTINDLPRTVSVLTQHNDNYRSGVQARETTLMPTAVRQRGMKLLFQLVINNPTDAQPLYVRSVPYPTGSANSVFTVTSNNTVYAFNTDTGIAMWASPYQFADSEPTLRQYAWDSPPTPVIDLSHKVMYVLFATKNGAEYSCANSCSRQDISRLIEGLNISYWLVAIDITNGTELRRTQISGSAIRSDGSEVTFDPRVQQSHPALLREKNSIYVAFGANPAWEGFLYYHGWVMRYKDDDFSPLGVFNTTAELKDVPPRNDGEGGGIWQGGGGLASDAAGNIYFLVGNGPVDASNHLYGDSFVKLIASANSLDLGGFFPVAEANLMQQRDLDLGSGGLSVVPGTSVLIGGGKTGMVYAVDGSMLTKDGLHGLLDSYQIFTNTYHPNGTWDYGCPRPIPAMCEDWKAGPHLHGSPIYWQGEVFDFSEKDHLKRVQYDAGSRKFVRGITKGTIVATENQMPGGLSELSARGLDKATGIIWTLMPTNDRGLLVAYKSDTLETLWLSDLPATASKPSHRGGPTVADGKLFVPTGSKAILVYGLGEQALSKRQQDFIYKSVIRYRPTMSAMQEMSNHRYSESLQRSDRVAPPEGQHELFRRSASVGATEKFADGYRASNNWRDNRGGAITTKVVKSALALDPGSRPWQLYQVILSNHLGVLGRVQWIQRIDTSPRESTYIFFGESGADR